MDEAEEIKKRKMEELQNKAQQEQEQQSIQQEKELQKQSILRSLMTNEARERLGRVKMARPDFGAQVEEVLIQMAQQGRLNQKLTEPALVSILRQLQGQKRDFKIQRL